MKCYSQCLGLTFAVVCSVYVSDFASAQTLSLENDGSSSLNRPLGTGTARDNAGLGDDEAGRYPRNEPMKLFPSHSYNVPTPRYSIQESQSLPFTGRYRSSCGGRILITETPQEIFVFVNGRSWRAKDADELRQRYPEAYRIYDRTLGRSKRFHFKRFAELKTRYLQEARLHNAFGGFPGDQFNTNAPQNVSVSVMENGKKVSITGNAQGMTMSVNGKPVRSSGVARLKKKFPDAFDMFEKQLEAKVADGHDGQWAMK